MTPEEQLILQFENLYNDPLVFIDVMWGLTPERDNKKFIKGKHLTWQQHDFFLAVKSAIQGKAKKRITITSGHGCHAIDTPIMMADGTIKLVQNIKVNDELMGDDSTPRKVLSLARGREKMYRVQYFDGTYYDVNESHILSLVASQSHGKQKLGDKTDISVRDYLKWSERKRRTNIGYKVPVTFERDSFDISPYLLGLWLGDGTSASGRITNIEPEIAEYLTRVHNAKEYRSPSLLRWHKQYRLFNVPGMAKRLRKLGLHNNKHIPQEYKTAAMDQRLDLLAGIIDTDGYVDPRNNSQVEIIQKNKRLSEDIIFIARSVGCHATLKKVRKMNTTTGKSGDYYLILISRNTWRIPTQVEKKKMYLSKKVQRVNLSFGFELIELEEGDYYGFELTGNHRYLLGDFTVTHNTGKGASFSMLILWYMYTRRDCQIACTAPNADQMHSVLWKEVAIWKDLMPPAIKAKFEWTRDYIRFAERPETWFARARTARKENPEALAGIHGDHVLIIADEASGVPDSIFHTAEGALTGEDYLMIMGSQPTRTSGYFYDSHHSDKENWQCLRFDSEESPLHTKDSDYIARIINKNGVQSDEYAIRVKGHFPRSDIVDDKGYAALFSEPDLKMTYDDKFTQGLRMGIDPAGEGSDTTSWVVRDTFRAKIVAIEKISTPKSILQTTRMLMDKYNIKASDVYLDAFGIGTNVAQEFAKQQLFVNCVNVGDSPEHEKDLYINRRAQMYWLLRNWIRQGGELFYHKGWNELLSMRYTREIKGRIQMMSKKTMKSNGFASPNNADALALTFLDGQSIITESFTMPEFEFDKYGKPQIK